MIFLQPMKRTKSGSQPTRIMPRRGKTRQNSTNAGAVDAGENSEGNLPCDVDEGNLPFEDSRSRKSRKRVISAENGNTSETPSLTEASASTSAQGSNSGRRKRKKLNTENVTGSYSSLADEALTLTDNRSSHESPELACSICLGAVENRAFTDACYHTFCFECLVEWSKVRAVCPLCKKSFHSIIHSFRSYDDYKLYQVPTSYVSNSVNISSLSNLSASSSSTFSRAGRFFNAMGRTVLMAPSNDGDHMLALRRRVYTNSDEMQLRGLWSSDGVVMVPSHQVSPAMFDCYPVMLERVRPWVQRDIAVIVGNVDVQTVVDIVLGLLRQFPITSEDFYERLFPFLSMHTRRFLLELDAFARSPFDMTTYDARVVYSTGGSVETPLHLPTEHVEDISSSDDSDIELVSPAVVSGAETAHNSHVSMITDHVVPDLLRSLRSFQHSLLMTFSSMSHRSFGSGLESPVPGPSGLGQAVATDESSSVGSRASMLAQNGDERSDSPMVLSDADSDIVVVDVDSFVQSPIHISSGEDDGGAERSRARRRRRRRRHRAHGHKERGRESEEGSNITAAEEYDAKDSDRQTEPHAEGHRSVGYAAESDLVQAVEQSESSGHARDQPSSRSSNVKLNDHSSPGAESSPSKRTLETHVENSADTFDQSRLKRSQSANSVSFVSEASADDVKPLTCKKHVSGHKSSKQKVRALVAEKRSAEGAEKVVPGDRERTVVGNNDQSSAEAPNEAAVPSVGESSEACADFGSGPVPVCSSSEEGTVVQNLATGSQSDDGITVPCIAEVFSLPADSSLCPGSEDNQSSSLSTTEVTCGAADQCLPIAVDNLPPRDGNRCVGFCDVVQTYQLDADEPAGVGNGADKADSCDFETSVASVLSPNHTHPSNVDTADTAARPDHPGDLQCLPSLQDLASLSDQGATCECTSHSSESSANIGTAAASSAFKSQLPIQSVKCYDLESQDVDECVDEPLQNDPNDDLLVVPQESETVLLPDNSSHQDLEFHGDTSRLYTDTANSENQSSVLSRDICSTASGMSSDGSQLIDGGLTDYPQSASSSSHAGLVIDENKSSPAKPSPAINESIVIGSPEHSTDSSDSDVEWLLETGMSGRQRCISISSSDSSVLFNRSDMEDAESIFSDSDSLEIFDEKPLASRFDDQSAESARLCQTLDNQPSSLLDSIMSDVASPMDVDETEAVTHSEEQEESKSCVDNAVIAGTISDGYSSDVTLQSIPAVDGCIRMSDPDAILSQL